MISTRALLGRQGRTRDRRSGAEARGCTSGPLFLRRVDPHLPGARENGGTYTHAAVWAVQAECKLGRAARAWDLFRSFSPVARGMDPEHYAVEPYVTPGNVDGPDSPHFGRGGWTWYTGSAGWMYRAGIEWILGFRLRGTVLHLDPCIPRAWRGFEVSFRYHSARYEVHVENPRGVTRGVSSVEVDGQSIGEGAGIPLADDGATHQVHLVLG